MNRLKPHLALLVCNVLWAMDYPFYNIVLPHYVHPMAMVSASLVATALFSLVPLLWQKAEKVERADIRKLIGRCAADRRIAQGLHHVRFGR